MDWIKDKLLELDAIFTEFPSVFKRSCFYMFLVGAIILVYQPFLQWLYDLKLLNSYPLQTIMESNLNLLKWGQIVVPLIAAVFFWIDVESMYEEKYYRKYRHLP